MRVTAPSLSRLAAVLIVIGTSAWPASGAVFRVNSELDQVDADIGDGACATASGTCTLRAAVNEANDRDDADVVVLPAGQYVLTIPPGEPNWSGVGGLDVRHKLRVTGAGAANTTIDGNQLDSVFVLNGLGAPGRPKLVLKGVTVTNGVSTTGLGGAINAVGAEIEVRDGVVASSRALLGGGINLNGSRLTMLGSAVLDNEADGAGGGIRALGAGSRVVLKKTVVHHNRAVLPGNGGGLSIGPGAELKVQDSVIRDNQSAQWGGGLVFAGTKARIVASRLENNVADDSGGAISVFWGDPHPPVGTLSITASVITGDVADADADGGGAGGGISASEGAPALRATTLSGNVDLSGRAPDCSGTLVARGGTVVGDATGCVLLP